MPQGFSSRVHNALIRRLQAFMAHADAEINDQPAPSEINENDHKESSDEEKDKEPKSHEREKEPMSRERSRSPKRDGATDEQAGGELEKDVLEGIRRITDHNPQSPAENLVGLQWVGHRPHYVGCSDQGQNWSHDRSDQPRPGCAGRCAQVYADVGAVDPEHGQCGGEP